MSPGSFDHLYELSRPVSDGLRIVLVSPYPPKPDGIGAHAAEVMSALEGDIDAYILTGEQPGVANEERVHRVASGHPFRSGRAWRTLRELHPDVIHIHFAVSLVDAAFLTSVAGALLARRRFGARIVVTSHEVRRELKMLGPIGRLLHYSLGRFSDRVVVFTEESRQLLMKRCGVPAERVVVVPLGMAAPRGMVFATAGSHEGPPLVLNFGFLHPDKGIEVLIEAVRHVREDAEVPPFRVVIAGDCRARRGLFRAFGRRDRRYREELHRAAAKSNLLDMITFRGYVDDAELGALLSAADVFVAPYLRTTQSGAVNRAAGAGAAIVASDLPGLRASLGSACLWVPAGDVVALATALRTLLVDPGEIARLQERVRAVGELQSMTTVTRLLSRLWAEAVLT